jgi:hypothetical protein
VGWFTQNKGNEAKLSATLEDLADSYVDFKSTTFVAYKERLLATAVDYYEYYFPEDKDKDFFDETMEDCREVLDTFEVRFPELCKDLGDYIADIYYEQPDDDYEEPVKTVEYGTDNTEEPDISSLDYYN